MRPTIPVRLVDPDWTCQMSGDCCRAVQSVTMTRLEAEAVMAYAQVHSTIGTLNKVNWAETSDPRFLDLQAGPCPFLEGNLCSIHSVRPYNCRRFGCLRPDVKAEPLVMAAHSVNAALNAVNNTQTFRDNTPTNISAGGNRAAGAATVAMTGTLGASSTWASAGTDIKAAAGGGVTCGARTLIGVGC